MAHKNRLYIVVDNYGLPRYADDACTKLNFFLNTDDALDYAAIMADANPNTIITVFEKCFSVFHDGIAVQTMPVEWVDDVDRIKPQPQPPRDYAE